MVGLPATAALPASAQQQGGLQGRVSDQYGQPVAGAQVYVKGQRDTSRSDATGSFQLPATTGAVMIAATGYQTLEQVIDPKRPLNIRLEDVFIPAPATIPVLYGQAAPKSITGAIGTVYSGQLSTTPALYTLTRYRAAWRGCIRSSTAAFACRLLRIILT
ncbi:carboxypeptidase-like regulatory domain-containing protein [Chitinophaga sedimenti]|uniref:carboxypeptidase regulatory-like domain-containing protein n=1 Tax=Chitinophaga sedimenti TaxID=2033606 RepID=UPI0020051518|nr:carboxypeptidase regulatory-like domain-containing protein [Chitinophaga sedimenti]MCK7555954.1 carboxypeptidase-like regulatory domain-containing protein [Chitinophaga sedimenti]